MQARVLAGEHPDIPACPHSPLDPDFHEMDVKTRHYQQLSHQLSKLQENISQSNQQFKIAADQLQQMQKLSISHASQ